jgi:hypothetical protein
MTLPVSIEAIVISLNLATLGFIMPIVFLPIWRGWLRLFVIALFIVNLVVAIINIIHWMQT